MSMIVTYNERFCGECGERIKPSEGLHGPGQCPFAARVAAQLRRLFARGVR